MKPSNILVGGDGRARIADFGLAQLLDERESDVGGSPGYAAPEVLTGSPPTTAADVYAWGVVAWELIAGRRAFVRTDLLALLGEQYAPSLPPLVQLAPATPSDVRDVVERSLDPEPSRRPTADEIVDVLRSYADRGQDVMRGVHGLGFTLALPLGVVGVALAVVAFGWIAPEILTVKQESSTSQERASFAWRGGWWQLKFMLKTWKALLIPLVGAVAALGIALKRLSDASGSGVPIKKIISQLSARPSWWPSWYPRDGSDPSMLLLPDAVVEFRFFTWWVLPLLSLATVAVALLALAPSPAVVPSAARWMLVAWLLIPRWTPQIRPLMYTAKPATTPAR